MDKESRKKKDVKRKSVGKIGEEIASNYLIGKGFLVIARNYRKKWGEIDIIARKNGTVHFFEVKTISRENFLTIDRRDEFHPEENIHPGKIRRLVRAAETFIAQYKENDQGEWQFDAVAVFLDQKTHKATVRVTPHII
ncbi:MAG: YraN family protein [Minisyncoccota bacterium]